jgi:hypothetical protein
MGRADRQSTGIGSPALFGQPSEAIMARSRKPTLPSSETKPAISEPATMPAVTFSPEALAALLNEVTESRKAIADLTAVVAAQAQNTAKPAKAAKPTMSIAGKTERSIKNEIETVRAFKRAGFGNVTCHVDVLTFNKWMAQGLRPIPGSKSLRVANLRLFHRSQCQPVTAAEKAANKKQQSDALARHDKAAKTAKVVSINANPQ